VDTIKPPVACAQCGEPVWPGQTLHVRYAANEEGEAATPMLLVPDECATKFDSKHRVTE
jgi:hypothetical protein